MNKRSVGNNAMILAAGLGVRMRPLTLTTPKPLVKVGGKSLIEYAFDHLRGDGIERAVVNIHYHAEQIELWLGKQNSPLVTISDERAELLDTGGGIAKALACLGKDPFFVLNSDSFWLDGTTRAMRRLRDQWDGARMDSLLLLCPATAAIGYDGRGDFHMEPEGRLKRRSPGSVAPFVYAGCFVVSPDLFVDAPQGTFSINMLWDKAAARGRLYGLRHDGIWIHVGTPESIALAESAMKDGMGR